MNRGKFTEGGGSAAVEADEVVCVDTLDVVEVEEVSKEEIKALDAEKATRGITLLQSRYRGWKIRQAASQVDTIGPDLPQLEHGNGRGRYSGFKTRLTDGLSVWKECTPETNMPVSDTAHALAVSPSPISRIMDSSWFEDVTETAPVNKSSLDYAADVIKCCLQGREPRDFRHHSLAAKAER